MYIKLKLPLSWVYDTIYKLIDTIHKVGQQLRSRLPTFDVIIPDQ